MPLAWAWSPRTTWARDAILQPLALLDDDDIVDIWLSSASEHGLRVICWSNVDWRTIMTLIRMLTRMIFSSGRAPMKAEAASLCRQARDLRFMNIPDDNGQLPLHICTSNWRHSRIHQIVGERKSSGSTIARQLWCNTITHRMWASLFSQRHTVLSRTWYNNTWRYG